jgi:hypothetical protein
MKAPVDSDAVDDSDPKNIEIPKLSREAFLVVLKGVLRVANKYTIHQIIYSKIPLGH